MLFQRRGIYYFRYAVPTALKSLLNRSEIKASLKTRDRELALHRHAQCVIHIEKIIDRVQQGMEFPKGPLFNYEVRRTSRTDQNGVTTSEETAKIDPKVIQAFQAAGLTAEEISELTKAFIESIEKKSDLAKPLAAEKTSREDALTLGQYVAKYLNDHEVIHNAPIDTRVATRFRRLLEIIDPALPLDDFTLAHAGKIREQILKLPAKNRQYAALTVNQTIAEATLRDPNYERFTAKTINDYLDTYRVFFKKAMAENAYTGRVNPFEDLKVANRGSAARSEKRRKVDSKHQPFSSQEVSAIFSTSVHEAFGSEHVHENFKYWIPLLGLLTGSRMSQIASLYCEDIFQEGGIWVIDFNENGPDKQAKNAASLRTVPMHPLFEKLGLPAFAKKVSEAGQKRLFPELSNFHRDTYAKRLEDWFNRRHLIDVGVRTDTSTKAKTFHSFRATLLDLLKRAGIEESQRNQIIGWTLNEENANNVARQHYDSMNLETLLKALCKIELPEALEVIPAFPIERPLSFKRPIVNQYNRKLLK